MSNRKLYIFAEYEFLMSVVDYSITTFFEIYDCIYYNISDHLLAIHNREFSCKFCNINEYINS